VISVLWVAGQVIEFHETRGGNWEMIGVFDSEEAAKSACEELTDFIGPVVLNKAFPRDCMEWPGAYYPLQKQVAENVT
jgi:hypothetical protein